MVMKKPQPHELERRTLASALSAEQRESLYQIRGYAATFNSPSGDLGGFVETVAPGAFKRALRAKQDVKALFNHSADQVLGRVGNGTLKLEEDERGLRFECQLNRNVSWHRDLWQSIKRGDIASCSFAFKAPESGQRWENRNGKVQRTLLDVDLFDVSACTYPAYPQGTSVSARSFDYRLSTADIDVFHRAELRRLSHLVAADKIAATQDQLDDEYIRHRVEEIGRLVSADKRRGL